MHASVLVPSMFIAHEPQMPSRQERRKVSVGSISFLILISASRTIGPQRGEVDVVGVDARVLAVVRVPAIDLEGAHAASRRRARGSACPCWIFEFFGRVNSAMVVSFPGSVDARLGRHDFDVVAERVHVHRAVVDARVARIVHPAHACASASSRRRAPGSPRAHARRGIRCGSRPTRSSPPPGPAGSAVPAFRSGRSSRPANGR